MLGGEPASDHHIFNRPPRAGSGCQGRVAHIENEGRLPRGVSQNFAKQGGPQRRFSERFLVVDHFRCLIAGPSGQPTSGRQQVRALPNSPRAQAVLPVIAVMHGKNANQGRTHHQAGITILWPSRRGPFQHRQRHHLGDSSRDRRLSGGIDRKAVAVFLHIAPPGPNPSLTAAIYLLVGIDLGVCRGAYFCNLLSVCLRREKKDPDVRITACQASQRVDELWWNRILGEKGAAVGMAPRNCIV